MRTIRNTECNRVLRPAIIVCILTLSVAGCAEHDDMLRLSSESKTVSQSGNERQAQRYTLVTRGREPILIHAQGSWFNSYLVLNRGEPVYWELQASTEAVCDAVGIFVPERGKAILMHRSNDYHVRFPECALELQEAAALLRQTLGRCRDLGGLDIDEAADTNRVREIRHERDIDGDGTPDIIVRSLYVDEMKRVSETTLPDGSSWAFFSGKARVVQADENGDQRPDSLMVFPYDCPSHFDSFERSRNGDLVPMDSGRLASVRNKWRKEEHRGTAMFWHMIRQVLGESRSSPHEGSAFPLNAEFDGRRATGEGSRLNNQQNGSPRER